MYNLSCKRIGWSFENLNLQIASCLLALAHLSIYQNKLSNESHSDSYDGINVSINDSSLCFLTACNVSQIVIRNSYISGRYAESSSSFLVIQNSNVTITNSTFTNNSIKFNSTEATLVNTSMHSNIVFVNCSVSGNTGYVGIITVTDHSSLRLINSDISYNRIFNESLSADNPNHADDRWIVRINESFVSIVNCTFSHNQFVSPNNGGSVVVISFFSRRDLYFEKCIFTNNHGTSLYTRAFPGAKLNITNCYIANNNSPHLYTGTFTLNGIAPFVGGDYYLSNCTFLKNYANNGGGVFCSITSTLHLKKCIFKENKAFAVAGVDFAEGGIAHFESCEFLANEGILHTGAIMGQASRLGQTRCRMVVRNCLFKNNRGINAVGALANKLQTELTVMNSTFINNTSELRAGAILLEGDAIANISDCTFINNSAVHHGCINVNSNVTLRIYSTHFIGNNAKVAAVIFSQYNVTVEIFFSKFEHNVGENCIEIRQNSSLIVSNSNFSENNISPGSVIFVYLDSKFVARNSTFLNHTTELHGAVIYGSQDSNIDLKESKVLNNQATKGGVIYVVHCTLHITNAILDSNNATDGGVIYTTFSNVLIHNSSCIRNFVSGYGGCLYVATSNVSLNSSNISFNQAFEGGAVMIFSNSNFNALRTKFFNNKAVTGGGAVAQRLSGNTALDQCSFQDNSVSNAYQDFGSDIEFVQCVELRVSQCKFVHNATDNTAAIMVNMWDGHCYLLTFKTNISYGSLYLSSTDKSFLKKALARYWIQENSGLKQEEANYASGK